MLQKNRVDGNENDWSLQGAFCDYMKHLPKQNKKPNKKSPEGKVTICDCVAHSSHGSAWLSLQCSVATEEKTTVSIRSIQCLRHFCSMGPCINFKNGKNTCFPRWVWHCLTKGLNLPKGSPKGPHFEGQGCTPVKKTGSARDAWFSLISPSMWGSRQTRVWKSLATCCQGWTRCWGRSCRCRRSLGPRCARRTPFGIQTWQREVNKDNKNNSNNKNRDY